MKKYLGAVGGLIALGAIAAQIPSADAQAFFRADLNPLHPSIGAGPLTVAPGILPGQAPANIHVEGNGFIGNVINGANTIAHAPEEGLKQVGKWIGKAVDDKIDSWKKQAESWLKGFLASLTPYLWWAAAAFAALVVIPSLVTGLVVAFVLRMTSGRRTA